jgi:hypothetical protein
MSKEINSKMEIQIPLIDKIQTRLNPDRLENKTERLEVDRLIADVIIKILKEYDNTIPLTPHEQFKIINQTWKQLQEIGGHPGAVAYNSITKFMKKSEDISVLLGLLDRKINAINNSLDKINTESSQVQNQVENPQLKPEKSLSESLGAIRKPIQKLVLSAIGAIGVGASIAVYNNPKQPEIIQIKTPKQEVATPKTQSTKPKPVEANKESIISKLKFSNERLPSSSALKLNILKDKKTILGGFQNTDTFHTNSIIRVLEKNNLDDNKVFRKLVESVGVEELIKRKILKLTAKDGNLYFTIQIPQQYTLSKQDIKTAPSIAKNNSRSDYEAKQTIV